MPIIFTNSNQYTPVNLDDPEEVAARIWWCDKSTYGGVQERDIPRDWNHPCDRDNAIESLRAVDRAREHAARFMAERSKS